MKILLSIDLQCDVILTISSIVQFLSGKKRILPTKKNAMKNWNAINLMYKNRIFSAIVAGLLFLFIALNLTQSQAASKHIEINLDLECFSFSLGSHVWCQHWWCIPSIYRTQSKWNDGFEFDNHLQFSHTHYTSSFRFMLNLFFLCIVSLFDFLNVFLFFQLNEISRNVLSHMHDVFFSFFCMNTKTES